MIAFPPVLEQPKSAWLNKCDLLEVAEKIDWLVTKCDQQDVTCDLMAPVMGSRPQSDWLAKEREAAKEERGKK